MKTLLFLLFLIPTLGFGNTVNSISDKALVELQAISNSWKKVKDPKTAVASVMFTKVKSTKLTELSKALLKLERPSNAERESIKKNRQKKIEKISLEMASTMMMLRKNPRSMSILTKGLKKIEQEMEASQKVFDFYFEPDAKTKPVPAQKR